MMGQVVRVAVTGPWMQRILFMGRARASVLVGGLAALLTWRYVANLGPSSAATPAQIPNPSWGRIRRR
ncbi:MAG: hypothetical protein ABJD13_12710 [Paracoccaceae bacterium]